jgi:hypothetical protein
MGWWRWFSGHISHLRPKHRADPGFWVRLQRDPSYAFVEVFPTETDAFRWRVVGHVGRIDARGRHRPDAGRCPDVLPVQPSTVHPGRRFRRTPSPRLRPCERRSIS